MSQLRINHTATSNSHKTTQHKKRKRLSTTIRQDAIRSKANCSSSAMISRPSTDGIHNAEYLYLGLPEHECQYCGALLWYAERIYKSSNGAIPRFSLCCQEGKVSLPLLRQPPTFLNSLLDYKGAILSKKFRENIRAYNSMFAFTSIGAKIDTEINTRSGPYIFKISGQNYHRMGSLLPLDNESPKFAQLYIYDTENEIDNRMKAYPHDDGIQKINRFIVQNLMEMFDCVNELVKVFRMARDRFDETDYMPIRLRLIGTRNENMSQYNPPTASEIAGLIVDDLGCADRQRDIVVEYKTKKLKRISDLHPSFMAMQYPILFPYGEDGFRIGIKYSESPRRKKGSRKFVTMREFYAYRIQYRLNEGKTLISAGKLFQQYVVDAFSCVEEERLDYIRRNQADLQSEVFKHLKDAVVAGDVEGNVVGKRVILPSSFTAGPRYMMQNYHDAVAICRHYGHPDLFITFTCNTQWLEIQNALQNIPGQRAEDRPDIVSRIFKVKVDMLMSDIKKGTFFGKSVADLYTIEFQKRGLPHVHILVWLRSDKKQPKGTDVDRIISAEIPDQNIDPIGFAAVTKFMIHGPCGIANSKAPCMKNNRCSKHFPKEFASETTFDENGFAIYKRRNDGKFTTKNGIELDNRYVVPHHLQLIIKYQAHINVEWCSKSMLIKYLFKYVNKGPDRIRAVIEDNNLSNDVNSAQQHDAVDEIKKYLDCRYLSAYEAVWRLFEFDIHHREPSVERLTIHMPFMNNVIYHESQSIVDVVNRSCVDKTMFTEWMAMNAIYDDARELTYVEFPTKWVWHPSDKFWTRRKRGNRIGRIVYIHPNSGELYFLRMLLDKIRGPKNFEDIRTVDGIVYETFRAACDALGLLGDDLEWHHALNEASYWSSASELRQLFVSIIMFCEVADPPKLFDNFWNPMSDDIVYRLKSLLGVSNLRIPLEELKNNVLFELETLFNKNGSSLSQFRLPIPNRAFMEDMSNRLLREELDYDSNTLRSEHEKLYNGLNNEQLAVYQVVLSSVYGNEGGVFFVYGHGGTGKTYLWQTIIAKLRSEGKIVLAVASSGIASLLLPGGRTAHSRFKIPIKIDEFSTCEIKKGTQLAKLLCHTKLIIWDEAPMNHKNCFEALDKSLRDVLRENDNTACEKLFGGKTILLGGDFRQILPVVVGGTRQDIVNASITKSYIWNDCRIFRLTTNMRLHNSSENSETQKEVVSFAKWILDLGDGKLDAFKLENEEEPTWIRIPSDILITNTDNNIRDIVSTIYVDLEHNYNDSLYLRDRAIITAKNDTADEINSYVLSLIPGDERCYMSSDSISNTSGNTEEADVLYPIDFLNSLKFNGVPHHAIQLKVGVPIMLLRNISQHSGLCNGTRLVVTQLASKVIQAEIFTGSHIGQKVFIPRILTHVTETKWPFILKRRQFPIRLCYAMTINKSQGQTLQHVGIYLRRPVFSHGQLYVGVSRVTSRNGLRILIENENDEPEGCTRNIVYSEIFDDLQR